MVNETLGLLVRGFFVWWNPSHCEPDHKFTGLFFTEFPADHRHKFTGLFCITPVMFLSGSQVKKNL